GATPGGLVSPQSGPSSFGAQTGGSQTGPGAQSAASGDSGSSSPGSSSGGASTGNSSSGNTTDEEGNGNAAAASSSNSTSGPSPNGQTFGGGPILGVASTSKAKTIRTFFDKNHYNDWLFVYMPQADRGGLLTGPVNPGAPAGNVGGLTPGQMPGGASGPSGPSGFGSSPIGGQSQGPQPQT